MKREIPHKVNAQFGFTDQSSSECAFRSGATLCRRTRSASFLSVTLTVGALGVLIPHQKATASSDLSSDLLDSVTSSSGLVHPAVLGGSKNFNNPVLSKVTVPSADSDLSSSGLSSIDPTIDWSMPKGATASTEATFSTTSGFLGLTHSHNQDSNNRELTAQSESAQFHRVAPGENLTEIAEKYQISPKLIADVNNIQDPNVIEADAELTIPSPALTLSAATTPLALGALATSADLVPPIQIGNLGGSPAVPLRTEPEVQPTESRPNIDLSATMVPSWATAPTQAKTGSIMVNGSGKSTFQSITQPKGEPIALMLKASSMQQQHNVPGLNAGAAPLMARRSVFPHIPVLDLPPLASADQFLPSAINGGNSSQNYIWPARGVLSSRYGWRWGRMHRGIDIAAPVGTPIVAAASGVVISAGWNDGGYGYLVKVRHPDQSVTLYAHNSSITTRVGAVVNQGEMIAQMGSTGRSTGPHCHFEIRPSGQGATDPMAFLNASQLLALN